MIITGSNGFLGSYVKQLFPDAYQHERRAYDLRHLDHIKALFSHTKGESDTIIHLAADVGGLQYNQDNPASIFYNNVVMNTQLIHYAAFLGCKQFIFVSSVCAYPQYPPLPTREHHLWEGQPEKSNLSYGLSKRIALHQLQAVRQQFGMSFEYPILANLYGPGDTSDHVIPDLIRKFMDKSKPIEIWGDGSQTRDFLFVRDAANALSWITGIDYGYPVNICNDYTVTIRQVVEYLQELSDRRDVAYNGNKPIGQAKRWYDSSIAKELGWQSTTKFYDGLKEIWLKQSS